MPTRPGLAARRAILRVVALAAAAGLAGISPAHAEGEIAVVGPMTGQYAATGAAMRAALAPSETRDDAVMFEDDGCRADTAVATAQRLVAMRVAVVIGHPCSSAAIAAAPVYAAAGIPVISTGARHPDLTDRRAGPLVFRLAGRDDRQGAVAAELLARLANGKPVAILHDRTFAMSTLAAATAVALEANSPQPLPASSARPATQLPFVASELNYDALAAKVATLAPGDGVGAVLFAGYPAEAMVIVKALRAHGVSAPFVGVDALAIPEFGQFLTPGLGQVFVLVSPDAGGPDGVAARTAAAIAAWQQARAASPQNPAAVIGKTMDADAASGRIAFDTKGDAVVPSYVVRTWSAGAWQPLPGRGEDRQPIP
jgi:branched-chain amino acid transport system substrate-binding protein